MPKNASKIIPHFARGSLPMEVDAKRIAQSYAQQYSDHASGLIQELIQNGIDAHVDGYDKVRITIAYDSAARTLKYRDYGTKGMSPCKKCHWGRLENGTSCHDVGCGWGAFHYFGAKTKEAGGLLGSRGQGKSLMLTAGNGLIVKTKVAATNESMTASYTPTETGWNWELNPLLNMKEDSPPGTEIIISGIEDPIHERLIDVNTIIDKIQQTWWPALKQGVSIRYGIKDDKRKISVPSLPTATFDDEGKDLALKELIQVKYKYEGKTFVGELDFNGLFTGKPVPEGFRGIALVKNNLQVIDYIDISRRVDQDLRDLIFGWAIYQSTATNKFLDLCEEPGHSGFRPDCDIYKKSREEILQKFDGFIKPIQSQIIKKKHSREVTDKERHRAQVVCEILNKALDSVPELNPMLGTGEIIRPKEPREPRKLPYISSVSFDKESYKYDDRASLKIHLHNPTNDYYVHPRIEIRIVNRNHAEICAHTLSMHRVPALAPATTEGHAMETVTSNISISKQFGKGRSLIRFTLFEEKDNQIVQYDRKIYGLWVMEEPPVQTRSSVTGGTKNHHGKPGSLRLLQPIPIPDSEEEEIPHADLSLGEIWFNTDGKRIRHTWDNHQRAANSVLFELIAEYFAGLCGDMMIDKMENREMSDIKAVFKQLEDARKKFLQICESDETNPR
jgi:energy-coupling factor transporter ATP-binding protein EcfA2